MFNGSFLRINSGYFNCFSESYFEGKREKELRERFVKERGGKCQVLGCEFPPSDLQAMLERNKERAPLEFHHVAHGKGVPEPQKKRFEINVSGMTGQTIEAITEELEKTVLICPNHHALIHRSPNTAKAVKFNCLV